MYKLTAILTILLLHFYAPAQEKYELQQIIRKALEENYQIQIVTKHQQMAQNVNNLGHAGFLPTVDIVGQSSRNIQTSEQNLFTGQSRSGTNVQSSNSNAMIAVDWVVFDGFGMFARRDKLNLLAIMSETDTRFFIEQTVADLSKLYCNLIKEELLLGYFRQLLEVSSFRYNLEKNKIEIGASQKLYYHQALTDFNADSASVLQQIMYIDELQIQINRLINRDVRLSFLTNHRALELQGIDDAQILIEKAAKNNRDLQRAQLERMLAEADYRIEKAGRWPQVNVFGNYSLSRQTSELGIIESAQSHGSQFGVNVRFNLFDGGKKSSSVKNTFLEQQAALLNEKDINAILEADIIKLTKRYHAYQNQKKLLKRSVEAAQASLLIAQQQFQVGTIDGYELRLTQVTALNANMKLLQIQYAMRLIEIDLFRISGILLEQTLNA